MSRARRFAAELAKPPPPLQSKRIAWSGGKIASNKDEAVAALFGGLSFQLFQAKRDDTSLQGEIWRMFLFFMLLALLVEGWLIRPKAGVESDKPAPKPQLAPAT